jgi:hypothetical protein
MAPVVKRPGTLNKKVRLLIMEANESYDEKLFTKPQSDHLKCSICFNIMKDPVQCTTQGHTFCRYCVSTHLDRDETCPTCREPLKKTKLIPNRAIRSMIEDAEIYCFTYELPQKNRLKGRKNFKGKGNDLCPWSGKLSLAEGHYNECEYVKVNCPHIGCEDIFLRSSLPEHINICLHRVLPCQWCNIRQKFDLLDVHLLVCRKRPVPCPNSCLDVNGAVLCIDPSELANHRNICSMESVGCKFGSVVCKVNLMRKDMSLHENDAGAHIGCLLVALQTAQTKITQLEHDAKYTELIVKVPVPKLNDRFSSSKINVSGHTFVLNFRPNSTHTGNHSLFLQLLEDASLIGPVNVEAVLQIVSYSAHPTLSKSFKYTYLEPCVGGGYGCPTMIETTELKKHFAEDGFITLRAKIAVTL